MTPNSVIVSIEASGAITVRDIETGKYFQSSPTAGVAYGMAMLGRPPVTFDYRDFLEPLIGTEVLAFRQETIVAFEVLK